MCWLHQILQIKDLYGMDDKFFIQRVFFILQEVYSNWDFKD